MRSYQISVSSQNNAYIVTVKSLRAAKILAARTYGAGYIGDRLTVVTYPERELLATRTIGSGKNWRDQD